MNVAIFKPEEVEQANEFINSVDLMEGRVEVHEGNIYVFYKPLMTTEEMEKNFVAKRLRAAERSLVEATIHKSFLGVVKIDDEEKLKKANATNDQEIENLKAQINLFKSWQIVKN